MNELNKKYSFKKGGDLPNFSELAIPQKPAFRLGLPYSPATRKTTKTFNAYKILISYGGGMGGASRDIYSKNPMDVNKEYTELINPFTGAKETIFTKWVVSQKIVLLAYQEISSFGRHESHTKWETHFVDEIPAEYSDVLFISEYGGDSGAKTIFKR